MNQPAKAWLAECIENLGVLVGNGEDPSMLIEIGDVIFEFRLQHLPGIYDRITVEINMQKSESG